MKTHTKFILLLAFLLAGITMKAQDIRQLPEPVKEGGKPLMIALSERQSSRSFANRDMSDQMMSNLLWAAFGINRPEMGKRTAPSSHNVQDIQVYAVTREGAYLYLPEKNALQQVNNQDVRQAMGKQDFTGKATVNLVYVSDFSRYSGGSDQVKQATASAHCGFIGQNVYLFCASEGLHTVFRAWIDKDKIASALNLSKNQHVIYSQTVGFPK
jgi:SagB-type dehydrogenase family enzyme